MDGGHTTEVPNIITYFRVISSDIIHIGFLLAALHVGDITSIDLENAYLHFPCADKTWFVGSNECKEDKIRVLLFVRALYGLRSTG